MTVYRPDMPGVEFLGVRGATGSIPPHLHASRCFILLENGARVVSFGSGETRLEPGTLAVIPAGLAHACSSDAPCDFLAVSIPEMASADPDDAPKAVLVLNGMASLADAVREVLHSRDENAAVAVVRLLSALTAEPAPTRGESAEPIEPDLSGPVGKARRILEASGGVSMEELSRLAGASRHHLSRCFKVATGLSPAQFGTLARLRRVRSLLAEGVPPAEAAAVCGFFDQSHLNLRFGKYMGFPPGQYARGCR